MWDMSVYSILEARSNVTAREIRQLTNEISKLESRMCALESILMGRDGAPPHQLEEKKIVNER